MIIDMHTHAFPETIAERTLTALRKGSLRESGRDVLPCTDGTARGLAEHSAGAGVELSVILPIVTNPKQTNTVNRVAAEINKAGGGLMSFGSVHPMDENAEAVVEELAMRGFVGIKLHPEFQSVYADQEEMVRICRRAERCSLAVTVHAGRDIGYPPPVHATPEHLLRLMDKCPTLTLIAAHLGGWMMWDEVADALVDTPIYFDTAFISDYIDAYRARDIILAHGAERVLFGSDCPWESPQRSASFIKSLDLTESEEGQIFCENARRILKL